MGGFFKIYKYVYVITASEVAMIPLLGAFYFIKKYLTIWSTVSKLNIVYK